MILWKRTLRTPTSERFLAVRDGREIAAIDLHHLPNGTVAGTVTVLRGQGLAESEIPAMLSAFDEDFLPDVDLRSGTLVYTVVLGDLLGVFEASPPPTADAAARP